MARATSTLACSAGYVVTLGLLASAYLIYRRRRRGSRLSTRALEESAGSCKACGFGLYLDAAVPVMRCPKCETASARAGACGTVTLDAEGSVVDFLADEFSDAEDLLSVLQKEVEWEQHDDRLEDGRIISQARLIAYMADRPGHVYSYPGIVRGLRAKRFSPTVEKLRNAIARKMDMQFNSAHLNLCEGLPSAPAHALRPHAERER